MLKSTLGLHIYQWVNILITHIYMYLDPLILVYNPSTEKMELGGSHA